MTLAEREDAPREALIQGMGAYQVAWPLHDSTSRTSMSSSIVGQVGLEMLWLASYTGQAGCLSASHKGVGAEHRRDETDKRYAPASQALSESRLSARTGPPDPYSIAGGAQYRPRIKGPCKRRVSARTASTVSLAARCAGASKLTCRCLLELVEGPSHR